jgi:hypothetical protein
MTVRSITIAAPDLPCLWAKAINKADYVKNRLRHKYLPSSSASFIISTLHHQHPSNVFIAKPQQYDPYTHVDENIIKMSEMMTVLLQLNIFHIPAR